MCLYVWQAYPFMYQVLLENKEINYNKRAPKSLGEKNHFSIAELSETAKPFPEIIHQRQWYFTCKVKI